MGARVSRAAPLPSHAHVLVYVSSLVRRVSVREYSPAPSAPLRLRLRPCNGIRNGNVNEASRLEAHECNEWQRQRQRTRALSQPQSVRTGLAISVCNLLRRRRLPLRAVPYSTRIHLLVRVRVRVLISPLCFCVNTRLSYLSASLLIRGNFILIAASVFSQLYC